MKLIKQSYKILHITPDAYKQIELAARTCYDSHHKITEDSAPKLIKGLLKRDHLSPFEFADIHVVFTTDRSVSHELVRHRIASYQQQSQRYVNYDSVDFILPPWVPDTYLGDWNPQPPDQEHPMHYDNETLNTTEGTAIWYYIQSLKCAENSYQKLRELGWPPERARKVLPNSTATIIHVKANFRSWQHILNLRYNGATGRPDPTMYDLMAPLQAELSTLFPEVFQNEEK